MSAFADLEFELEEPVMAAPPPMPARSIEDEYAFEFEDDGDLDEKMKRLMAFPIESRIAAYYLKRSGAVRCPLTSPVCQLNEFLAFCQVISGMGIKANQNVPVGSLVGREAEAQSIARSYSIDELKEGVLGSSKRAMIPQTPSSAVLFITAIAGTESRKDTSVEAPMRGWTVKCPGLPVVKVHQGQCGPAHVVEGGEEFFEAYNSMYKQNVLYYPVSTDDVSVCHYVNAHYAIAVEEGELTLRPAAIPPDRFNLGVAAPTARVNQGLAMFPALAKRLATKVKLPAGLPARKFPQMVLEYVVYMARKECPEAGDRAMANMGVSVAERLPQVQSALDTAMRTALDIRTCTFSSVSAKGEKPTKGEIAKYRNEHELARDPLRGDLPKVDSVGGSGFGGSRTSVAFKAAASVARVEEMCSLPSEADAYGVGSRNYWYRSLSSKFARIVWCDARPQGSGTDAVSGVEISKRDVMDLIPGSCHGRFLADDTAAGDSDAKLHVIARAGYEAGFVKMMYGMGGDGAQAVATLSEGWLALRKQYSWVEVVKYSPHSLEYFILFGNAPIRPGGTYKEPPVRASEGGGAQTLEEWIRIAKVWDYLLAHQVYVYNIWKTLCARTGVQPRAPACVVSPLYPSVASIMTGVVAAGRVRRALPEPVEEAPSTSVFSDIF